MIDIFNTTNSFFKQNTIKAGFTLAEVLVTLAIIGIVAALTLPTLITSIQDNQYKVAWKKNYSVFSQATNQFINEQNGNFINLFTSNAVMQSNYNRYLKVIKTYPTWGGWHSDNNWYLLNGTPVNSTCESTTYLADGSMVCFDLMTQACNGIRGNIIDICGEVYFDVNGIKKPNTIGKDIFSVYVRSNSIIPRGSYLDDQWVQDSCIPSAQGFGCANKYLLE